ncbi:MAG: SDR family oxidoreductase [Oceanococcus sp.]
MLKPKTPHALITGGSSGIGLELAALYLQRGWSVSLLARNEQKLEQARMELSANVLQPEQHIVTLSVDVGDSERCHSAIDSACQQLGAPEVVVLSAGIAVPGYFSEIAESTFEDSMRINYFGSLYSARAALPHLRAAGGGSLVFISSGAALLGIFGYSAYSPSKFAVRGLAEVLRGELAVEGIHVCIAYPPDTDTPQYEAENRTKPLETKAITASAGLWTAQAVAKAIANGVDKKRFSIPVSMELRMLARLQSVLSPLLNWWFDRVATKAKR